MPRRISCRRLHQRIRRHCRSSHNLPGNNTISTIAAIVDQAKFRKAKTQELVDRVASRFVVIVLILATATFLVCIAIGIAVRHQGAGTSVVYAIIYGVSVLIVSCPCAIGLCVLMVIMVGGGGGRDARNYR